MKKWERLVKKKNQAVKEFKKSHAATVLKLKKEIKNSQEVSQRKVQKLQKTFDSVLVDWDAIENFSQTLQAQNEHLKSVIATMQSDLETKPKDMFTVETKTGRYYSSAIRKLYYILLADFGSGYLTHYQNQRYCINSFGVLFPRL